MVQVRNEEGVTKQRDPSAQVQVGRYKQEVHQRDSDAEAVQYQLEAKLTAQGASLQR